MNEPTSRTLPQTIPVLDLSEGKVVRAVRGRRREYRPLRSELVPGSDPIEVAKALLELGFAELYVADLDAIQDGRPQFDLLCRLVDLPATFLVDPGIRSRDDLVASQNRLASKNVCYVLATETCARAEELQRTIEAGDDPRDLALGLDFVRGRFRTSGGPSDEHYESWIAAALQSGIRSVVALDVDRVGSDLGFAWPADLDASPAFRDFERKISGGGVRSIGDLERARAAGCDAVLVGSALYDGRLSPAALLGRV